MEIESKFLVTIRRDFHALESLSGLAHTPFLKPKSSKSRTFFLILQDKAIMAAGYYLRVRKAYGEDGRWVTIKSLGGLRSGTHRREEYVSFLPEGMSVLECPDSRIRNMIFEFTAGLEPFSPSVPQTEKGDSSGKNGKKNDSRDLPGQSKPEK